MLSFILSFFLGIVELKSLPPANIWPPLLLLGFRPGRHVEFFSTVCLNLCLAII